MLVEIFSILQQLFSNYGDDCTRLLVTTLQLATTLESSSIFIRLPEKGAAEPFSGGLE